MCIRDRFYAFSTENWARPEAEVRAIMALFGEYLNLAYDYQKENNRVVFLGDRAPLPEKFKAQMAEIEEKTKMCIRDSLHIDS